MSGLARPAPAQAARIKGRLTLTLLALSAFSFLIALCVWQLERREWKNDLIARFEEALSRPAATYEPPARNAGEQAREFQRVTATGAFLDGQTAKMLVPAPEAGRAQTGDGFGYLLFTPFKTGDTIVLVNRGFAPRSVADSEEVPGGGANVTGILRLAGKPGWFTPSPDFAKRLFYSADIPAMAKAAGLGVDGTVVSEYIEAEPMPRAGGWPKPRDPRELLAAIPNNHLEYALTWFGLAAALAIVYRFLIART